VLAVLLFSDFGALRVFARSDDTVRLYSLEIQARREISRLTLDRLERALLGGLARPRCAVKPAVPKTPADLLVVVEVEFWRERTLPGGRPVLDRRSGREKPGYVRKIETRYRITIRKRGDGNTPVYEKRRRVAKQVGTTGHPFFSPEDEVLARTAKVLTRDIERALCKAVDD